MVLGIFAFIDSASGGYLGLASWSEETQQASRVQGLPAVESCQQVICKSLAGLPVQDLGDGHFRVPVLQPVQDSLPFAMALDLYSSSRTPVSTPPLQQAEELLCLHYVLDGSGQLVKAGNDQENISAGDSILAPHGHTGLQGHAATGEVVSSSEDAWSMASLTILLPKELINSPAGGPPAISKAACRAAEGWIKPTATTLTPQQVAGILVGARETAEVKVAHEAPPTADGLDGPASSRFGPAMARRDFPHASSVPDTVADKPVLGASKLSAFDQNDEAATQPVFEPSGHTSGGVGAGLTRVDEMAGMTPSAFANSVEQGSPLVTDSESANAQDVVVQGPAKLSHAIGSLWGLSSVLQWLQSLLGMLWWRAPVPAALELSQSLVLKRALSELQTFQLPNQTNRLGLIFDPLDDQVPFTFGVEIFEPGHKTTPHRHPIAHELFFILAGSGEGFCNQVRFRIKAGDVIVLPPGSLHGIDVDSTGKMYCLELMLPNDKFAELVRAGTPVGGLLDDDLSVMIAAGRPGAASVAELL